MLKHLSPSFHMISIFAALQDGGDAYIRQLMKEHDDNNNNQIEFVEFVAIMLKVGGHGLQYFGSGFEVSVWSGTQWQDQHTRPCSG